MTDHEQASFGNGSPSGGGPAFGSPPDGMGASNQSPPGFSDSGFGGGSQFGGQPGGGAYSPPPPKKGMSTGCKVALACGIATLVVGIAGLVGTVFLCQYIGTELQEMGVAFENLGGGGEVGTLNDQNRQENPFSRPSNDVVTEASLERYLAVREKVVREIEGADEHTSTFLGEYRSSQPDVLKLLESMKGLGELKLEIAKLLLDEGYNPDEYAFFTMMIYFAAEEAEVEDTDMSGTQDDQIGQNEQEQIQDMQQEANEVNNDVYRLIPNVPPENLELFSEYSSQIDDLRVEKLIDVYMLIGTYQGLEGGNFN